MSRSPFAAHDPYAAQPPASAGGSAGAGALSFDVTEADFRQSVLERSLEVPVLLDCWAPWCGPCRSLGPVLERVVQAYGGRFVLAKLNTDEAPQISAALQIRSIPLVVLFVGGHPVDQFTGALPEGQVRAFLDRHLGPQQSEADLIRQEAVEAPDAETAEALLREALTIEPGHVEARLDLAERLLARSPEAQVRGFSPARFSFNSTGGGRCSACAGQGSTSHEMSFLPDVTTPCEVCLGARFDPPTLEVRYLGLSIGDVLDLSIEEAAQVFAAHPRIAGPLSLMVDLGVGYLKLGQGSSTLSGGEAQRTKMVRHLGSSLTDLTYVFDEPTIGLHPHDIQRMNDLLLRLRDKGNTVLVVEHKPETIAIADHAFLGWKRLAFPNGQTGWVRQEALVPLWQ